MELTDAQKQAVKQWVDEGAALPEIQKRLSVEFGISMTFMDVRFLVIDLGLEVQDKPGSAPSDLDTDVSYSTEHVGGSVTTGIGGKAPPSELGTVSVEVDRVTKPGSLVSGSVRFSDGVLVGWFLDQFGRLALNTGEAGYTPSEQDLQAFQQELKKELAKRGF